MFEEFHFLRPEWLLLIPIAAGVFWYWLKKTQQGSGWEDLVDSELLSVLLDETHKKSGRLFAVTMFATALIASLAMAGPAWEKLPQNVEQKEDTLIILLDLSLSMLAEDVKPSRIDRARQKIADVLRTREEGQTALVAYAGDAHAVVPLTDDVATIENLLFSLSPEMMPVFGSNPDHALQLTHELFANAGYLQGRILMITDGIDNINSVSRHRSPAFPISIIGIGTESGSTIPLERLRQPGRVLKSQEGNDIVALLDEARLREVAGLTYGKYERARVGDADVYAALDTALPSEDETIEVEREFDTWYDQGHWLALLLLPIMVIAFRKGVLVVLVIGVGLPLQETRAATFGDAVTNAWASLWQRADQRGVQKLRHGSPEQAAALFEDPKWRSVAEYRSGNYATALNGFIEDLSTTGAYNSGNALARLGEYENAIAQYNAALEAQPDHEDALFNRDLVQRLLEQQQEAQQQEQDQQNESNDQSSQSEDQQQENQEQAQQDDQGDQQEQDEEQETQQDQPQEGEQQEVAESEDEANRDERQEALEQWLRRVPDDPGGLLRRKFSHETKQRLRKGDYLDRQGDKLW